MKQVQINEIYKFPLNLGGYAIVTAVDAGEKPSVHYKTADSTVIQSDNSELYQDFFAVLYHDETRLDANNKTYAHYQITRHDGVVIGLEVEHTSTWQDTTFKAFKAFLRSEEIESLQEIQRQAVRDARIWIEDGGSKEDDDAFIAMASEDVANADK